MVKVDHWEAMPSGYLQVFTELRIETLLELFLRAIRVIPPAGQFCEHKR
jgi:hypothetical protein